GDLFIVWNDAASSWMTVTDRPYYKAGEFLRVKSRSGAAVTTDSLLFHGYGAGTLSAVKLTTSTVRITGGEIIVNDATNAAGIEIWNGYRCVIRDIRIRGASQ